MKPHPHQAGRVSGGSRAYVLKGVSARALYVSPSLAAELLVSLTQGKAPDPLQELTDRERNIRRRRYWPHSMSVQDCESKDSIAIHFNFFVLCKNPTATPTIEAAR